MPSEQFERKLRARLEHAQVQPRPELWEAIAHQVAEQSGDKRGGLWIWLDGILGLFLISLFLFPLSQYHLPQPTTFSLSTESITTAPQMEQQENLADELQSEMSEIMTSPEVGISPSSASAIEGPVLESLSTSSPSQQVSLLQPSNQSPSPVQTETGAHRIAQEQASASSPDLFLPHSLKVKESSKILNNIDRLEYTCILLSISDSSPDVVPWTIKGSSFQPSWILSIAAQGIYAPEFGLNPFAPSTEADLRSNFPRGLGGNQQIEDIYAVTFPRSGFVGRIGLAYQFSPRLSVESGIGFSQLSQGQYRLGSLGEEAPIGPTTPDPFITYEDEAYQFQQSQIEIPLQLNIALTQGLHRWIISGGMSINHQLAWKVRKSSSENLLNEERSILSTNQSLVLGQKTWYPILQSKLLYQRQLNSGMAMSVGPVFRYQLQGSYSGSQSIGQSRMNAGLELGIQIGNKN